MRPFELTSPTTVGDALAGGGMFLAGGTTLVDLMKLDVLTPRHVLDINALPLRGIEVGDGLRIGALERMSDVAVHPGVYPMISRALLLSASQQLRNMASIGGRSSGTHRGARRRRSSVPGRRCAARRRPRCRATALARRNSYPTACRPTRTIRRH